MIVKKNTINDYKFNIELIDDKNDTILIEYGGADLYWIMLNYYEDNFFKITKDDGILFLQMEELFKIIKKNDKPTNKVLNDGCFEWVSESYGLPEDSNKLTIRRNADSFDIHFFLNPNSSYARGDTCYICFCLNGSRNSSIAMAFSNMLLQYKDIEIHNLSK